MNIICQCLIIVISVLCLQTISKDNRGGIKLDFFSLSENFTVMIKSDFDVLVPIDQYKKLRSSKGNVQGRSSRPADIKKYWPDCIVHYEITDALNPYRTLFKMAVNHWEAFTCLNFSESTSAQTRVRFVSASDCTSPHGFQLGVIEVGVHKSCLTVRNIIHEIGHIVGMIHEHNRPDRDDFIKLHLDKVSPRARLYFDKYDYWDLYRNINVGYDYASIMHLSDYNGVLDTGDPNYQDKVGKGQVLSFRNVKHIHYLYQCLVVERCPRKACPFNGFVFSNPLHGKPKCECVCDSGFLNNPLRLCSTLFNEFPGPAPLKSRIHFSYALSMKLEPSCSDLQSNCAELKEKGLCRTEAAAMFTECAQTCGFCDKGNDLCMDYDSGCHMMASSGACDDAALNETMQAMCPKACGRCTNTNSPCDFEHLMEEPANNGRLMISVTIFTLGIIWIINYC